jgi:hypothetical protein
VVEDDTEPGAQVELIPVGTTHHVEQQPLDGGSQGSALANPVWANVTTVEPDYKFNSFNDLKGQMDEISRKMDPSKGAICCRLLGTHKKFPNSKRGYFYCNRPHVKAARGAQQRAETSSAYRALRVHLRSVVVQINAVWCCSASVVQCGV